MTLDILVIEDDPNQIAKAKESLPLFLKPEIARIDFAKNYEQYQALKDSKKYRGIITDIFFPFSEEQPYTKSIIRSCDWELDTPEFRYHLESCTGHYKKKVLGLMDSWKNGKTLPPTGTLVVLDAWVSLTPIVCISEYVESNPILDHFLFSIYKKDIPFIDFKPGHDLDCKKWAWAGRALLERINEDELNNEGRE